jgi:Zn-dependent protease with chaperone function
VIAALASLAVVTVALPHVVRLDNARPATAAILWTAALTLRALTAVSVALFLVLVSPETTAFKVLTHWCEHSVLPFLGVHVDVHGHTMGAAAVLAPAALIAVSLGAALVATFRAARAVAATVRCWSLGAGPQGSVIIGGLDVVLAAAGLLHPRIVISAGALAVLDDDELAAGLAHEKGHIARRHHLLLTYAECCRAVARMLPGTRRAVSEFRFQLERDADEWALRRDHDPRALASAICKAATTRAAAEPAMVTLGGGAIDRRLDELLRNGPRPTGSLRRRLVDSAAVLIVCVTLTSLVVIPAEALAGGVGQVAEHSAHECLP